MTNFIGQVFNTVSDFVTGHQGVLSSLGLTEEKPFTIVGEDEIIDTAIGRFYKSVEGTGDGQTTKLLPVLSSPPGKLDSLRTVGYVQKGGKWVAAVTHRAGSDDYEEANFGSFSLPASRASNKGMKRRRSTATGAHKIRSLNQCT